MSDVMFDPFGTPDGASADISDARNHYVQLDQRLHGGIGRSPTDSAIRVVAGGHGTGKSLFMRKMRDHAANDLSRHAALYSATASQLQSSDVVSFAQAIGDHTANAEEWKALCRSAVDHSPDGTRRPWWLKRPLKPVKEAYALPEKPFGRS